MDGPLVQYKNQFTVVANYVADLDAAYNFSICNSIGIQSRAVYFLGRFTNG